MFVFFYIYSYTLHYYNVQTYYSISKQKQSINSSFNNKSSSKVSYNTTQISIIDLKFDTDGKYLQIGIKTYTYKIYLLLQKDDFFGISWKFLNNLQKREKCILYMFALNPNVDCNQTNYDLIKIVCLMQWFLKNTNIGIITFSFLSILCKFF